jgi:hypothetical protein
MKKFLRIVLTGVVALVALVLAGLLTTTIVNTAASASEATRIEDYGQRVEVDGRRMNVRVAGEGDQTIVLLPGFGTGSPVLDFSPLTDELASTYRVVVVEPLGYGLSDQTDVPRTTANIVSEIHEAVSALGIDRYVLMGHSIAGISALDYVERFRDEVTPTSRGWTSPCRSTPCARPRRSASPVSSRRCQETRTRIRPTTSTPGSSSG